MQTFLSQDFIFNNSDKTTIAFIVENPELLSVILGILAMIILLTISALISGSEVAFFSLGPNELNIVQNRKNRQSKNILQLLKKPENLLATILITNNLVNVGFIILSSLFIIYDKSGIASNLALIDFSDSPALGFFFQTGIMTFILLLFGEIIPKVYASNFALQFATIMSYPLVVLEKLLSPFSSILISSTSVVNKRFSKKQQEISMTDLSHALDLTSNDQIEDKNILKGIVKFGNIEAKEIMTPRLDVVTVHFQDSFSKVLSIIVDSGYSRIPVIGESFDDIKGILYVKDLLPYYNKPDSFRWLSLIRSPYFVPQTKKINDLLEEFQLKKIHLSIVIDEYGGGHGIVTMEDILEEIFGEITDEHDEEELFYEKLDENRFRFLGKTLLNDFYKVLNVEDDIFDAVKGEADTLAGLILEIKGEIPKKHEIIKYNNFSFKIKSVDNRRIKDIEVIIN